MTRLKALTAQKEALAPEGRQIRAMLAQAKSENRGLTADEQKRANDFLAKVQPINDALDQLAADADVMRQAKALADEIGGPDSARGKHLALSGRHAKSLAAKMIGSDGAKALIATGSRSTGIVMLDQVYEQGRPPVSILDVLPARLVAPNYSFLRQTTRTNNAAPVAQGAEKPTSPLELTEKTATLQVIAHLSQQIPIYTLADNANLEHFVTDEMIYGLRVAIENQVLNGNGTAPNLTGILKTSGIQSQTFATDILTSIRKGITKLESQGQSADVLAISAADWESVELLAASSGAVDVRGVPLDATARRLWGVQAVVSNVLPAKTAVLLDFDSVSVDHDGAIDTRWSDALDDDFSHNVTRCRVEGRFGLSVYQPLGVVKVDTADE